MNRKLSKLPRQRDECGPMTKEERQVAWEEFERKRKMKNASAVARRARGRPLTAEERTEAAKRAWEARARRKLETCEVVPNAPFRDRYLKLRDSRENLASDICRGMGWTRKRTDSDRQMADTSRLERTLGISRQRKCRKSRSEVELRTVIPYDMGVKLADLMDMDYTEAGV